MSPAQAGISPAMSTSETTVIADRYRLVRPVGQGGMSRVWLARDVVLGRDVALKELVTPPGLSHDEELEMRLRAMREARALARLNNPNVVKIFDIVRVAEDDPWIVIEYVTGQSVQDALDRDGSMSPVRAAEIGYDVLNALRAAHASGVVHRDVKPSNVLLASDGRVLLTDFGLATAPDDPRVTRAGQVLGSPSYMAPERANDGVTGPAADLWSLGAMLFRMVEGHPPFARSSIMATLTALATEPVPSPQHAGDIAPLILGLLAKDPAARLSEDDAASMLAAVAGAAPIPRRRESSRIGRPTDPIDRPVDGLRRPPTAASTPNTNSASDRDGVQPPAAPSTGADPPGGSVPSTTTPTTRPTTTPTNPTASAPQQGRTSGQSIAAADGSIAAVDGSVADGAPSSTPTAGTSDRRARGRRGGPRRRTLVIGALIALAGVIALLVAVLPAGGTGRAGQPSIGYGSGANSRGPGGQTGGTPSGSGSPRPSTTPSTTPSTPSASTPAGGQSGAGAPVNSPFTLPPGWQMRGDGTGFSVPVPVGWQFGRDSDGRPLWRDPGHTRLLLIDQSRHPKSDPVKDWLANEAARRSGYDNYVRIKIVAVDYWDKAADWEFTYTRDGHPLHVLNRGFVTAPDQAYSIYWSTPASEWANDRSQLDVILRGFHPARQ